MGVKVTYILREHVKTGVVLSGFDVSNLGNRFIPDLYQTNDILPFIKKNNVYLNV